MKTEAPQPVSAWLSTMQHIWQSLPEIPDAVTPRDYAERERAAEFRSVCPPEFFQPIEQRFLANRQAFDEVAGWSGLYPGPIAAGATGTAKTRAAWAALGRLYVKQGKPFVWFPVRRLIAKMEWYEEARCPEEFFKVVSAYPVVMVDDLEKINWQFQSHSELLFSFYDWVYRNHRPCLTTTNMPRDWWAQKMGEAFARRLFDEAHRPVAF